MATQTWLDPMNASSGHPKVKVSLKLADPIHVAGGEVTGKVEMECKADKGLGLGTIMVELFAVEELTSRDHSATSTFLRAKRLFQGPGLPPSNAVHPYPTPGEPALPAHHYPARRGLTTFLFKFRLPESSPSAINFGSGLAYVRYEARASVSVAWNGQRSVLISRIPVDVVQSFPEEPSTLPEPEGVIVGENGKIWVQGRVLNGFMVAGQPACIELQVKNHSTKKNTGLSVSLTRELVLPKIPASSNPPLQISDTLTSVSFRGAEYVIQAGVEGVANLVVDVPRSARGVRGGRRRNEDEAEYTEPLFEVRCVASVKLSMGLGSKDVRLDIPVLILHPLALSTVPIPDPYVSSPQPYNPLYYDPAPPALYQAASPIPFAPSPVHMYSSPPTSPPRLPFVNQGQVWLPPPSAMPYHSLSPPPTTPPPPHPQYAHHYQPVQSLVSPYVPPLRPSSTEPIPSQPLHGHSPAMPTSYVQPPLPSMSSPNRGAPEREEGKGDRASRIAMHLRMSSRHRSVSPPAHRFAIPVSSEPPALPASATGPDLSLGAAADDAVSYAALSQSPSSSPRTQRRLQPPALELSTSPARSQPSSIVSPRPMLSPKHSFSKDPFEQITQVENLERIAAQVDDQKSSTSMSGKNRAPDVAPASASSDRSTEGHKTLPAPPVPSTKDTSLQARARLDTLFPADTPPTPTLAAVASLKAQRLLSPPSGGTTPGAGPSGLDALEAKLLAQVGTRKIEGNQRPDVRSVLPIEIPRQAKSVGADPADESAISSLTLPALGSEPKTLRRAEVSRERSDRSRRPSFNASNAGDKEEAEKDKGSKKGSEKKPGHSGRSHDREHEPPVRDGEFHRLRKAAQSRVAAWLGSVEPETPPHADSPPPAVPIAVESTSAEPPAAEPPVASPREEKPTPVSAAPNPRSSGFVPISTLRRNDQQSPMPTGNTVSRSTGSSSATVVPAVKKAAAMRLAVYPPVPADPEVRYDVRSARGGRGGRVTSVAAIWASAMHNEPPSNVAAEPKRAPVPPPKSSKPVPSTATKAAAAKKPPATEHAKPSRPPALAKPARIAAAASPAQTPNNVADLSVKRARMIKASSSPAVVSSSLAIPMLSSTATLARPVPRLNRNLLDKLPPAIAEAEIPQPKPADAKPPGAKGDLAFGQARLRELIKRYQGQTKA